LASESVKIRSLENGNPESDMKKKSSVELSIRLEMVYHTKQKGANLLPLRKTQG
jgi:hypothetical protein